MKDFNFFSSYKKSTQKSQQRIIMLVALTALVTFVGFCAFTVNYVFELRMHTIYYELNANNLFITNPGTIDKINRYADLNDQLTDLTSYNTKVAQLSKQLEMSSLIKTTLLQSIAENITEDTSISSLSVSANAINISGTSGSEASIAAFEHYMAGLDYVDSVFVSSIRGDEGYSFVMSVRVKEVTSDVEDK